MARLSPCRLPMPAGSRQGDIRAIAFLQDTEHPPDEGRVQERHVGGADERDVGAPGQRGQPGGDALQRAFALVRIVGYQATFRQLREILARGTDDDDRPARRTSDNPDRAAEQRGPMPVECCLGGAHPG